MAYPWDSPSVPTTAAEHPLRLPAINDAPWEYARLLEDLYAGGSAAAYIQRPQPGTDTLTDTQSKILVFDKILPGSTKLLAGTGVRVERYNPAHSWHLADWTAIRR